MTTQISHPVTSTKLTSAREEEETEADSILNCLSGSLPASEFLLKTADSSDARTEEIFCITDDINIWFDSGNKSNNSIDHRGTVE